MSREDVINTILLKPRFSCSTKKTPEEIFNIFKNSLENKECPYCHVVSMNQLFIDVPPEKSHFWSPQLQIEIEKDPAGETKIKGIVGPKPHVWTMFMFLYFLAGAGLIFSFIWYYVHKTMDEPSDLQFYVMIGFLVLLILIYLAGQIGKRMARQQTEELKMFLSKIIQKT